MGRNRAQLLGRADELNRLGALFEESRHVTIVGGAGVGKSVLAREHTSSIEQVEVVDLGRARSGDDALRALGRRFRATFGGGGREAHEASLVAAIADRGALLVLLDDAEACRDGLAEIVTALSAIDELRLLVTSRVRLGTGDERVLSLEGLATDAAIALFVEHASRLRPGVSADDPSVRELARLLDGVPLAIELAAGRSLTFTPAELVEHVRASRLDTLVRPLGGADSMRGRLAWSVGLLSDDERRALVELSVVPGPVSFAEATALLSEKKNQLLLVEALREHHLARAAPGGITLDRCVRELASEGVDSKERDAAFERWTAHLEQRVVVALGDRSDRGTAAIDALEAYADDALERMLEAHTNAPTSSLPLERAALFYACINRARRLTGPLGGVAELGARLAALVRSEPRAYAIVQAHRGLNLTATNAHETRAMLEEAAALAGDVGDTATELTARLTLGTLLANMYDREGLRALVDQIRARPWDDASAARIGQVAAALAIIEGDPRRAAAEIDDALARAARAESTSIRARVAAMGAIVHLELDELERAASLAAEALACSAALDDVASAAFARGLLAEIRLVSGNTGEALKAFQECLAEAFRIGATDHATYAMMCRGFAHLLLGRLALANADFTESSTSSVNVADQALALAGRGAVAALRGDLEAARSFVADALERAPGIASVRALADAVASVMGDAAIPPQVTEPRSGSRIGAHVAARLVEGISLSTLPATLVCTPNGFVAEGHTEVSLASKPKLLALFRSLASAHAASPERWTSRAELVAQTWPGERMREDAALNRLKVSLSSLRKLGLPIETSVAEGVRLAAGIRVERDLTPVLPAGTQIPP